VTRKGLPRRWVPRRRRIGASGDVEAAPSGEMGVVAGARSALGLLTVVGGAQPPSPDAVVWFPVVGGLIGAALGLLWWGSAQLWSPVLAAAIVVAADVALTGMLHLDGLVDSADGLLAHMSRDRRLQVMREPTVGAFGVVTAVVVLVVRWAALASLHPSILLLCGLWALARTAMVVITAVVPPARPDSLASGFVSTAHRTGLWLAGMAGTAGAAAALVVWHGIAGAASTAAAAVAAGAVAMLARRRVGGYTGDVLGAAGALAETVGLVVAAARW